MSSSSLDRLEKNVLRQSVQTFVNDLAEFENQKDSVQLILDAKDILRFYWTTSELSLLFKEKKKQPGSETKRTL